MTRMNKIILSSASKNVLYEPLTDNTRATLQMDNSFGLASSVCDHSVNFLLQSTICGQIFMGREIAAVSFIR